MAEIDLSGLSLQQLKALKTRVDDAISGFELRRKAEARAAVEKAAQELGFTLTEVMGGARKRRGAGIAKYAHPENPAKTWSGFGRKPGWIADALSAGRKLEDFVLAKVGVKKSKS